MSLNTHLRTSGDHAVLPFDPACPVCRDERLAGRLPATTLVSPRLTALAVAGVTAGCTLAPAPGAMAQEPPIALPPGGYEDPGEEALEDEGPLVEDEPVEPDVPDPNLPPPVLPDDPALAIDPADPPVPVDPSVLAGEPVPEGLPAEPPPAPAVAAPAPAPAPPPAVPPAPAPRHRAEPSRAPRPAAPVSAAAAPATPAPAPGVTTHPPSSGASHIVRPGDSLWSIAAGRLGADASPAAVAAFVEAIWHANSASIRTGDPDLLHPGTRLVLPPAPGP